MNSKIVILGILLLILAVCGVYGSSHTKDINNPGIYEVVNNNHNNNYYIHKGYDVNIKADNVLIIGNNKNLGVISIKKSDLKNITIVNATIKELKIDGYSNNKINLTNVVISGGGSDDGIYIKGNNNKIFGDIKGISGNKNGICIDGWNAHNKILNINGEIIGNKKYGIYINKQGGGYNEISGNITKISGKSGIYIISDGGHNNITGINGDIIGTGDDGIHIESSSNNNILGNIGSVKGDTSIYLVSADNTKISKINNEIKGNKEYGILIKNTHGNEIVCNGEIIGTGKDGIHLESTSNNKIVGNITHVEGKNGIYIDSASNNKIDGVKGDIVGTGKDGDGIHVESASDTRIRGDITHIKGNSDGIYIDKQNNNYIIGVNGDVVGINGDGIHLESTSNNKIVGNITHVEGKNGIYIDSASNNNITGINGDIYGTSTKSNYGGIHLESTSNNKIVGNISKIKGNCYGIYLDGVSNSIISGAGYIPNYSGKNGNIIYHNKIYGKKESIHGKNGDFTAFYNYIDNNISYKGGYIHSTNKITYYLNLNKYLNGEKDLFKILIPEEDVEKYHINVLGWKNYTNYLGNQYNGFTGNDTNNDGIIDNKTYYSINNKPIDKYALVGTPHPITRSVDLVLRNILIDGAIFKNGIYYLTNIHKNHNVNLIIGHIGKSVNNVSVELNINNSNLNYRNMSFGKYDNSTITKTKIFPWTPTSWGTYTLKGTVDPDNKINETNESNNNYTITVKVININADFNYSPEHPIVNQTVKFTPIITVNNLSNLNDLGNIHLTWDFGDGSSKISVYLNDVIHKYKKSGIYPVTMHIKTDIWEGDVVKNIFIEVNSSYPPIAIFDFTVNGSNVTFNASKSYDIDGYIANYSWDFGDGTNTTTTNKIISHKYNNSKTYTVKLTIVDNDRNKDSTIRFVSINVGGIKRSIPIPLPINILLFITTIITIAYIGRWYR